MLSPKPSIPCPRSSPKPNHSRFLALAFPRTGAYDLCRTKGLSSHDGRLGHPLLHMQLETRVPPCVFFDWWFSPRELWGYWLVDIVVSPIRLQTSLAPWVLSLASSLEKLCYVQRMAVSIQFCICQALAEPLR